MLRHFLVVLTLLAGVSRPSVAQFIEEKTPALRVVSVDGSGSSFLVPHATRTTLKALDFQKQLFGYDPPRDLTLLLMDLADTGNGSASSVPHDW